MLKKFILKLRLFIYQGISILGPQKMTVLSLSILAAKSGDFAVLVFPQSEVSRLRLT